MVASAPQTPYGLGPLRLSGAPEFPASILSEMNRTEPSPKTQLTPPVCQLWADITPRALMLPIKHDGLLGGKMALNPV